MWDLLLPLVNMSSITCLHPQAFLFLFLAKTFNIFFFGSEICTKTIFSIQNGTLASNPPPQEHTQNWCNIYCNWVGYIVAHKIFHKQIHREERKLQWLEHRWNMIVLLIRLKHNSLIKMPLITCPHPQDFLLLFLTKTFSMFSLVLRPTGKYIWNAKWHSCVYANLSGTLIKLIQHVL